MRKIIGYTDSINTCDCCGKVDLKGTYCVDVDGVELYYGSVCAFKNHGIEYEDQAAAKKSFSSNKKAAAKLAEMESNYNGSEYSVMKMLKHVQNTGLDFVSFAKKYGKVFEETKHYTAYEIGSVIKMIEKSVF